MFGDMGFLEVASNEKMSAWPWNRTTDVAAALWSVESFFYRGQKFVGSERFGES